MFVDLITHCFYAVLFCSGIPLLAASILGLITSVFQAATQIQEQSLSYIIKFAAVSASVAMLGSSFSQLLCELLRRAFEQIEQLGRLT